MTRKEATKQLNKAMKKISSFPKKTQISLTLTMNEKVKCPKCGRYEGNGYSINDTCGYTFIKCKCGYSYNDY